MLNINTNITSLIAQNNLTRANTHVKTSIERLSTGFRINRASDDAANMSIAKNMNCQISGTDVAIDNTQQATNLLQTADGALDNMQNNLLRVRDLTVQALNGTYSSAEKAMIQDEINNLIEETYKQRNNTMFNKINIFGSEESPDGVVATSGAGGAGATQATGGTKPVTPLTEEEAIAQGYTCIHNEAEFANIKNDTSGKYCLMGDIDFSQVSNWGYVEFGGELNGNGYSINNLVINDTTNPDMTGLFTNNFGTIKNLNLNNVSIDKDESQWDICGLSTYNHGTIDNCSVSGRIKSGFYSGGVVAENDGTIISCSSSVIITGYVNIGGLVGVNNATISDCSASGNVTGNNGSGMGGLVGHNSSGTITNCSSSAAVTGDNSVGGLVGNSESGTIDKSYSTGDVSGNEYIGGLIGRNSDIANISNSYALGNVSGNDFVGGLTGLNNNATVSTSYSTGTVTGTGDNVGGFVGTNGDEWGGTGNINSSYTTSELGFIGNNYGGTVENNHGRTSQEGVTAHDASWFKNGDNLSFLGEEYDTTKIPPDLKSNSRFKPTPTTETVFQIGANSGEENTLTIDTGFSLNGLKANVLTIADGEKTLNDIDAALENISTFRATIGATQNRLESVSQSLLTRKNNMEASHSTIMDTDYGFETSKLVKNQILQNVTASLLAQANTNPQIALRLL